MNQRNTKFNKVTKFIDQVNSYFYQIINQSNSSTKTENLNSISFQKPNSKVKNSVENQNVFSVNSQSELQTNSKEFTPNYFKLENTELKFSGFSFSNFNKSKNSQDFSSNQGYTEKRSQNRRPNSRLNENSRQQVVSITYEEIGLFPRSFNRVFDRFFKQLFFDVENLVIQEYRFYRYLFLTTVKCLFILIFLPFCVNFLAKNYLVRPVTEYYWNTQQSEIFLNSYQQKQAYSELHNFEEKIYFESLILPFSPNIENWGAIDSKENPALVRTSQEDNETQKSNVNEKRLEPIFISDVKNKESNTTNAVIQSFNQSIQNRLQQKTLELAMHYNEESIEAITNFFADLLSFGTLCFLLSHLEIQINITKSFLLEVFFGLDDSKKSLLILFVTDLLVGYHSPNIWELFFQSIFDHYGLPESETTIFLLVATLPVLLDVLFKYLIFRHLNRASPATVATYHAMIE